MNRLALQVQQGLGCDPHAGDLYVFRGKLGDLVKILWHDWLGMSIYLKRLELIRFMLALACRRRGADLHGPARPDASPTLDPEPIVSRCVV